MKLVDILARELTEWPLLAYEFVAQESDGEIYFYMMREDAKYSGANTWLRGENGSLYAYPSIFLTRSDDWQTSVVSKQEWQSARAAYLASIQPARDSEIAAVVEKPANPWRRNRGRKTPPVADGARIELKLRNGIIIKGASDGLRWTLGNLQGDIMQWRYAEPQHEQEKPMAQTIEQEADNSDAAFEKVNKPFTVCDKYKEAQSIEVDVVFPQESFILPEGYGAILEVEVKDESKFDPIALRDEFKRITADGAELSQKMAKLNERMEEIEAALRAEGFALVAIDKSNR